VWYHCFASYLVSLGFVAVKSDTSMFIYHRGIDTAYLLLYVDNIVLTALRLDFSSIPLQLSSNSL
jgi:hypothetical protein